MTDADRRAESSSEAETDFKEGAESYVFGEETDWRDLKLWAESSCEEVETDLRVGAERR